MYLIKRKLSRENTHTQYKRRRRVVIDRISSHSLPARRAVSELTSQEIQSIPDRPPPSFSQTHLAYYSFLFSFFTFPFFLNFQSHHWQWHSKIISKSDFVCCVSRDRNGEQKKHTDENINMRNNYKSVTLIFSCIFLTTSFSVLFWI